MRKLLIACVLAATANLYLLAGAPGLAYLDIANVFTANQRINAGRADADSPANNAEIRATLREVSGSTFIANGRTLTCIYSGAQAESLIVALNSANLSTQSLEHRIIARCQTDGQLGAGSISGTAGH